MPFKKGHKKIGGKAKGTQNVATREHKERIDFVLSLLDKTIEADIAAIGPTERSKLWNSLQEFVRPKLARTELTGEVTTKSISETTIFSVKCNK